MNSSADLTLEQRVAALESDKVGRPACSPEYSLQLAAHRAELKARGVEPPNGWTFEEREANAARNVAIVGGDMPPLRAMYGPQR